jgi:type IV secretion system protein VirB11
MNAQTPRGLYLDAYLRPLQRWLDDPTVTDILINRPGEVWVETLFASAQPFPAADLDDVALWRLVTQIAAAAHQGVNRESPLLSATLPDGARVQAVAPPATRGSMAIAIRKHVVSDLGLDDYARSGAFDQVCRGRLDAPDEDDRALKAAFDDGRIAEVLRLAVRGRKNIVVSGGTSTGKTTFLNALIKEIPRSERLIVIEDAAEVRLDHPNAVGLIAASSWASCAGARPSASCAPSILDTPGRSPPSTPTARGRPSNRSP